MQIGLSNNEFLFGVMVATGACRMAWRRKLRHMAEPPLRRPLWASLGTELFVVVMLIFTCRVAIADWPSVPRRASVNSTLPVADTGDTVALSVTGLPTLVVARLDVSTRDDTPGFTVTVTLPVDGRKF